MEEPDGVHNSIDAEMLKQIDELLAAPEGQRAITEGVSRDSLLAFAISLAATAPQADEEFRVQLLSSLLKGFEEPVGVGATEAASGVADAGSGQTVRLDKTSRSGTNGQKPAIEVLKWKVSPATRSA